MGSGKWRINLHLLLFVYAFVGSSKGQPKEGCPGRCGNLRIPYPFGTKEGCYLRRKGFLITCHQNQPFIMKTNVKVLNISLYGELNVESYKSYTCYNRTGYYNGSWSWFRTGSFFTLSKKNKFTAVGCDTWAYLKGSIGTVYSTGCITKCNSPNNVMSSGSANGSCSGVGCCQISIPGGVKDFKIRIGSFNNHSAVYDFNPCSYAFIAEDGYFNFSILDLKDQRNISTIPAIFDWSIGSKTCEQVGNTNMCNENSECVNSRNRLGYTCRCRNGYEGNPYLPNGCQDINECARGQHTCGEIEFCHNTDGSFFCRCPKGYQGDATKACTRQKLAWTIIVLGTTIGLLIFLLGACGLYMELRRRKHIKLRERFFEQNGGFMLRRRLSATWSSGDQDIKICTAEELKRATNNYHGSRILGEGGQGTVYKGILSDNQEVAIKKARIGDLNQVEQFINELMVVSQINHKNVVKLLGCCLETEVPLLIYEFVNNGTLFDHFHGDKFRSLLWETRLKIAREIAGTLFYLHSYASVPIIHRDIKSANILLDDKFIAKVSGFGASRLIPSDKEQLSTLVQGTLGYLDPEYFHTSKLNEKSDVYSFGVVLMELLTGQKALCFDRPENARHLVTYFSSAMAEYQLDRALDSRITNAKNHEQLEDVARLAVRCTRVKGEDRPTMKQVASELEGLRVTENHPWADLYPEDSERLLPGDYNLYVEGNSSNSGIVPGYDSIKSVTGVHMKAGR